MQRGGQVLLPLRTMGPVPIYIDNSTAMKLAKYPELHSCTMHIKQRHHFIHEKVLAGDIVLHQVESPDNLADLFTKLLAMVVFQYLVDKLGVISSDQKHLDGGSVGNQTLCISIWDKGSFTGLQAWG